MQIDESSLPGTITTRLEAALGWARKYSLFQYPFVTACCGMEFMSVSSTLYDTDRFGAALPRFTPRQSDLMIVSGRVAHKMAEPIRQLYEQMLEPKYVMAMGACSSTGGMFSNYSVLQGVDKIVPVDVYVPGCPPRPEAVMEGLMVLQERIKSGIPSASQQQESQS